MTSAAAAALARTARRYRVCRRFTRHYVASKLRMDPVHADVLALAEQSPFGRVIDVGCGYGQLGVALLEAGLAESVTGLDRRVHAVAEANRAGLGLAFTAEARDLSAGGSLDGADTVLLVDVLYQLDGMAQAALLDAAARAAGQLLLIRTANPADGARFRLTRVAERLFRAVWPTAGAQVNVPTVASLIQRLNTHGFDATVAPCARGTPFANVLIMGLARRQSACASPRSAC